MHNKAKWLDDAAQIEDANDARAVADLVGGNIHRFDPMTGVVV